MRKTKQKKISTRVKIIVAVTALAMFLCTLTVIYMVLGSYDGLGLRQTIPENPYDMSHVYEKKGFLHYDDGTYQSVTGIDVSVYQKDVDWDKVKGAGVDFAMIRVGYRSYEEEGDLALDSKFKENLKGARKAGLDVGVYFFSQAKNTTEAIREARFVIRHIRGKGVTYPVVFDMEPIDGADRITDLNAEDKTEIADAFCQVIDRNGYTPMIYGNPQWLNKHVNLEYLTKYDTWLAHYTDETDYPYAFQMWQYSQTGKVDGIKGHVDLNMYFIKS